MSGEQTHACKSYVLRNSVEKHLVASRWVLWLKNSSAKSLVDRGSPKAIHPKVNCENINWLRLNSGMGIVEWIAMPVASKMGNPHAYHLRPNRLDMVRRQRLNGDWYALEGLANPSMLKIQSGSYGNIREPPMGGLNARTKKQQFITKRAIVMINTLNASHQMRQLLVVAWLTAAATCLVAGNPLEPFLPRVLAKATSGQEKNLGMVKIERIGRSACLLPKQMVGRQRLNGYGYCKTQCLRYSPLL